METDQAPPQALIKPTKKDFEATELELKKTEQYIQYQTALGNKYREILRAKEEEVKKLEKDLETSRSVRDSLTSLVFDLLLQKMSKPDVKKLVREVEEKAHLDLFDEGIYGDDSDTGSDAQEPSPEEVLTSTLRKRDARVLKASKVDEKRKRTLGTCGDVNNNPKPLQGAANDITAGTTGEAIQNLVLKRKANAME